MQTAENGFCGVTKCCFCVEHLEGVRLIGWIFLILSIINLVGSLVWDIVPGAWVSSVTILACFSLVIACHKRSEWLVLPWLALYPLTVVANVIIGAIYAANERNRVVIIIQLLSGKSQSYDVKV